MECFAFIQNRHLLPHYKYFTVTFDQLNVPLLNKSKFFPRPKTKHLTYPKIVNGTPLMLIDLNHDTVSLYRATCSAASWWWTRSQKPVTPCWRCWITRSVWWSYSTRTAAQRSSISWSVRTEHETNWPDMGQSSARPQPLLHLDP